MTVDLTPTPGPRQAVDETPDLAVHVVRRTTSTDVLCPDGFVGPLVVDIRGRDAQRRADGELEIVDEVRLLIEVDGRHGTVTSVGGDTAPRDLSALQGANVRRGFGRVLVEAMPDDAARRSLLFSVLEDLNGASLVSGYAPLRQGLLVASPREGAIRAEAQQDICAGWARGGAVVEMLRSTGENAVPIGPVAPAITGAGDRWHAMPSPPVHTVRRLRCLDVGWSDGDRGGATARAHLRDSYLGEDAESVMHEYLVRARFEQPGLTMEAVDVEPRVLPWHSCPSAAGSAASLVGVGVDELPGRVRAELIGTSTCTHLNSTLRSLADVRALLTILDRTGA